MEGATFTNGFFTFRRASSCVAALPHSACRRWSFAGPLLHLTTIRLRGGISEMCINDFDGHAGMMTLADPEIRYAILYTL